MQTQGWRRIGTAIVRWPAPVLAVTIAIALVGLLVCCPATRRTTTTVTTCRADTSGQRRFAASDRHFDQARLNPELLMIETDHDLRNPADFIVLDKVAKAVFHIPGIGRAQTITRPLGTPLDHSTLGFQMGAQAAGRIQTQHYQEEQAKNLLKQADELRKTMATLHEQMEVTQDLSDTTHETTKLTKETVKITEALRDDIANFDDFFRPIRSYFYWEKHCFDIPACWTLRSIFNAFDGIDAVSENIENLSANLDKLDQIQPKLVALIPPQIASQQANLDTLMSNYATTQGLNEQAKAQSDNATAQGDAFDKAENDDTFYLPPEATKSPDFARGLKQFISPDGHSVRLIISHEGDPAPLRASTTSPRSSRPCTRRSRAPRGRAPRSTWRHRRDYKTCTRLQHRPVDRRDRRGHPDFRHHADHHPTVVAAFVIVGTVLLSLGASFGLSVLLWQYILGVKLHWMVLAMAIILLLAVGLDYNLLLISRLKKGSTPG